jgi:hypothetical protein
MRRGVTDTPDTPSLWHVCSEVPTPCRPPLCVTLAVTGGGLCDSVSLFVLPGSGVEGVARAMSWLPVTPYRVGPDGNTHTPPPPPYHPLFTTSCPKSLCDRSNLRLSHYSKSTSAGDQICAWPDTCQKTTRTDIHKCTSECTHARTHTVISPKACWLPHQSISIGEKCRSQVHSGSTWRRDTYSLWCWYSLYCCLRAPSPQQGLIANQSIKGLI